ncbi:hypothetical protein FOL47_003857, partial [Perkinsus chesapeaki]
RKYIDREARKGVKPTNIKATLNSAFSFYRNQVSSKQIGEIKSAIREEAVNFSDLEDLFSPYKIDDAMLSCVRDGKIDNMGQVIYYGATWGQEHFACMIGNAAMLTSLHWYMTETAEPTFAIYQDCQNKLIRNKLQVMWVGSNRTKYNARSKKYQHSFVPFMMAIVDCECTATYTYALEKLDWLVRELSLEETCLKDYVPFVVHDAHQGALAASRSKLPDARNGRCFFHITKNIKDQKKKLGPAYNL